MEELERAAKEHAAGVRHYQDRKSHAADDFKAGALWMAEYLCHIPIDEIIVRLHDYYKSILNEEP